MPLRPLWRWDLLKRWHLRIAYFCSSPGAKNMCLHILFPNDCSSELQNSRPNTVLTLLSFWRAVAPLLGSFLAGGTPFPEVPPLDFWPSWTLKEGPLTVILEKTKSFLMCLFLLHWTCLMEIVYSVVEADSVCEWSWLPLSRLKVMSTSTLTPLYLN